MNIIEYLPDRFTIHTPLWFSIHHSVCVVCTDKNDPMWFWGRGNVSLVGSNRRISGPTILQRIHPLSMTLSPERVGAWKWIGRTVCVPTP